MKLEQVTNIAAPREAVWALLMDIPKAASLIPGVKDVELVKDLTYTGTLQVGVGPMKLNLQGELTASPNEEDYTWSLEGNAQDRRLGGGIRVLVEAEVKEESETECELYVSTDVQFIGRIGTLGQPLIRSKSAGMMKDFVKNLEKEIT